MDGASEERVPAVRTVAAVVGLAIVVRVAIGIWRGEALLSEGNGLFYMHDLARSVADGDGYRWRGVPNVFQQPGYVFLLAGGYLILGAGWQAVLAVNTLVGAALVALTSRVAGRLDPRAAVPAGLVAALHPLLVWHGLSVADTSLFSLALVGWLDAVLAELRRPGWRARLMGGLWVGLAFLTRPSLLPLLPVGLVAILIARRSWRAAALSAGAWLVLALAITGPWMMRNYGLTGRFPLVGTHGPESMWAANNPGAPRATELDSTYDAVSAEHRGTELDVRAFQVEVPPREAVRREQQFRDEAARWVKAHPGTFARMCAVRLGRIWDVRYHPTHRGERPIQGLGARRLVHLAGHGLALALAIAGVIVLWRRGGRRRELLVVLAVLAVYSLAHSVGAGYSRVRVPVDPLVAALAGCSVPALLSRLRAG